MSNAAVRSSKHRAETSPVRRILSAAVAQFRSDGLSDVTNDLLGGYIRSQRELNSGLLVVCITLTMVEQ